MAASFCPSIMVRVSAGLEVYGARADKEKDDADDADDEDEKDDDGRMRASGG